VRWLRLQRCNIAGAVSLHAGLHTGTGMGAPTIITGLTCVEVRKLDERGMLLFGLQRDPGSPIYKLGQRQAWFCKPIPG